jgi:hypothetical protein
MEGMCGAQTSGKIFFGTTFLNRMTLFQMDDLRKKYHLLSVISLPEAFNWQARRSAAGQNLQELALGSTTPMPVIWH